MSEPPIRTTTVSPRLVGSRLSVWLARRVLRVRAELWAQDDGDFSYMIGSMEVSKRGPLLDAVVERDVHGGWSPPR